jgi:beta-glucanase (GH16 family)
MREAAGTTQKERLMHRFMVVTLMILAMVCAASAASKRILAWHDEFNGQAGAAPDATKWGYDRGGDGWGNKELEEYTSSADNVFQDGQGHLAIRAVRTESGTYTSGRIKTKGLVEFQYGKIEARIRIPFGQGIWPAFWMLGNDITGVSWPKCGEIDILENVGREPATLHGTVHGPGYSGGQGISALSTLSGAQKLSDRFHVFAVEWSEGAIEFFLDGKSYAKVTSASLPADTKWVFDHPFFLLMNLAVGGEWPGNPDATTSFPQTMLVDWVRVWKATETGR